MNLLNKFPNIFRSACYLGCNALKGTVYGVIWVVFELKAIIAEGRF